MALKDVGVKLVVEGGNKFKNSMSKSESSIGKFGKAAKKYGKMAAVAIAAVGAAAIGGAIASVKAYAQMGDEVQKMALRTGFATEALSELRHAAEISGSSLSSLEKGVKKMAMSISDARDGLETYTREFDKIGISIVELDGLKPEEQFFKIAGAIGSLEDPTQRAASAQKLLGRAGTELLPLFAEGAEGIAVLRQEAHELGIVFDQEAANKAALLTDTLTKLRSTLDGIKFEIADGLLPVFQPFMESLTLSVKLIKDNIKGNERMAESLEQWTRAFGVFFAEEERAKNLAIKLDIEYQRAQAGLTNTYRELIEENSALITKYKILTSAQVESITNSYAEVDALNAKGEAATKAADKEIAALQAVASWYGKSGGAYGLGSKFGKFWEMAAGTSGRTTGMYQGLIEQGRPAEAAQMREIIGVPTQAQQGGSIEVPVILDGREIARAITGPLGDFVTSEQQLEP